VVSLASSNLRPTAPRSEGQKVGYHPGRISPRPIKARQGQLETPLAFEELQRELHQRIYRFMMRLRFVIAPLPVLIGGFVVITDPTLWRRIAIGTVCVLAVALSLLNDLRVRQRNQPSLRNVILVVGLLLHPVILFATGGILSPVLIAMLFVCFVASTMFNRRTSGTLVALQIASIAAASLLEYSKIGGSLVPSPFTDGLAVPSSAMLVIFPSVDALFFLVTREMGCRIQQAFAEMLERTIAAREQSLQLYREQLADLTLLSGEIAHELKNPLASVKGLAALLGRRSEGQEPEPLTVLRREVDRMQDILEEFLNFSRPLAPLNLARVDLSGIAAEVARMHEGISELRNLAIKLVAPSLVEVHCDPRKVRQILVNLLQNALDASDGPGRIVLRVESNGKAAEVAIEDEGTGIDPTVEGRVFDAGVTSKSEGSGLGLNVARGLARQHGGEVTLLGRMPRGCVATLRLPLRPVPDARPSATAGSQPEGSQPTRLEGR
jgi:two-component system, NtrC family, sensor histidine kinase HydH